MRSSAYGRPLSCRWNINSTYTTLLSRGSLMISVPLIVGILWTCLKPDILAIPEVWIADKLFVWFPAPTFENLWSVTRKRLHDKTNNRQVNLWTIKTLVSWPYFFLFFNINKILPANKVARSLNVVEWQKLQKVHIRLILVILAYRLKDIFR